MLAALLCRYKGVWAPKQIANPEYKEDDKMYLFPDSGVVGIDLWQVLCCGARMES